MSYRPPFDSSNDRVPERERPFWIKITGQATDTNRYSWEQVNDADPDFPTDLADAFRMSGTTAVNGFPAYEINGRTDVPIDGSAKVLAHISASGEFWIFQYGEASEDATGAGAGWLASLDEDDCLILTVVSAVGLCSEIDQTQVIHFEWDEAQAAWVSLECFEVDTGCYHLMFWLEGGHAHLAFIGLAYEFLIEPSGPGHLIFSANTTVLCTQGTDAGPCGDNSFRVKIECVCCEADWYDGPGWYCLSLNGGACTPYEIIGDGDQCEFGEEWTFCSGPWDTEAEATANCGTGSPVETTCCPNAIPSTLHVTLGSAFCPDFNGLSWALTYQASGPDAGKWVGTQVAGGHSLTVKFACGGSNFSMSTICDGGAEDIVYSPISQTCDPLQVVGSVTPEPCCPLGVTLTVTV